LLAAVAGWASSGCQSAFFTSAANALGARLPTLAMSEQEETTLGAESYAELLRTSQRTAHPEYQAIVEKVGRRIADVADRPDFDWEFTVLAGPTQNAFCLPGGKVVVYEGLLPLCENEAGLAVVISHEIAHAVARHGGQRVREQAVVEAVGEVVSDTVNDRDAEKKLLVETAYGMGTQVGLLLPFSRAQETQADSIGLMLMARAGYNPEEAPRFWRRFQSAGKAGIPELLSTHPADERRAANLIDLLPQAERYYAGAEQKLDRGVVIVNLLTGPKTNTVAKAAAPPVQAPTENSVVPANAFAPAATPAAEWIGAAPSANEQAAFTAPTTQAPNSDSGNPFLAPTATAAPVEEKGWAPTVH
jgi:metalloendopeptidase OMA1, mitochondrial